MAELVRKNSAYNTQLVAGAVWGAESGTAQRRLRRCRGMSQHPPLSGSRSVPRSNLGATGVEDTGKVWIVLQL